MVAESTAPRRENVPRHILLSMEVSFHRYRFCEVSGLIDIQTPSERNVVGKQLQRDDSKGSGKQVLGFRDIEDVVGIFFDALFLRRF